MSKDIPATNEIKSFLHCRQCVKEKPDDIPGRDWTQIELGFTDIGLQVWCQRHQKNIIHIDFEGCQHPANMTDKA